MLGAIVGDTIGSVHEWRGTKTKDFPLFEDDSTFTDDSVLTFAVARVLLDGVDYVDAFHDAVHAYPGRGYGGNFNHWAHNRRRTPYNSFGVPEAIEAFLESTNFGDAVRNAISLGGDADTLACITGSIAEAFYGGVPMKITIPVLERLDPELFDVLQRFDKAFPWLRPVRDHAELAPNRPATG